MDNSTNSEGSDEIDNLKKSGSAVSVVDDSVDTACGYTVSCKPKALQKCANAKAYLVIISLCSIMQGSY